MTDPVQAEAEGQETVEVEYKGETYTFPASLEQVPGDVVDAIDDQKLSHALRSLLDEDQWKRFKATKPLVKDYAGLFGAFSEAIGLESAGN